MSTSHRAYGFSIVEAVMIIGVVVLLVGVGVVGWRAFTKSNASTAATASSSKQSAEVITTKADLEHAEKSLNDLNFDDSNASAAASQANL